MRRAERMKQLVAYFSEAMPAPETELHFDNPYQLLVAVVLSAQCTDKRVNLVTPALFAAFPTPAHLAAAAFDDLYPYVKTVSYPNNKTKHLLGLGRMLMERFNGEIPATLEELQQLPGVGRKTANVIVSVVHRQPALAVDTHVFRVSRRMGLVGANATTPLAVEKQLVANLPSAVIPEAHHWLILHGRYICLARRPKCEVCPITHLCQYYERRQKAAARALKVAAPTLPVAVETPGDAMSTGVDNSENLALG